jgi:hypothetical protein
MLVKQNSMSYRVWTVQGLDSTCNKNIRCRHSHKRLALRQSRHSEFAAEATLAKLQSHRAKSSSLRTTSASRCCSYKRDNQAKAVQSCKQRVQLQTMWNHQQHQGTPTELPPATYICNNMMSSLVAWSVGYRLQVATYTVPGNTMFFPRPPLPGTLASAKAPYTANPTWYCPDRALAGVTVINASDKISRHTSWIAFGTTVLAADRGKVQKHPQGMQVREARRHRHAHNQLPACMVLSCTKP